MKRKIRVGHELIVTSGLAKKIGMRPDLLRSKMLYKTLTVEEREKIKEVYIDMFCWLFNLDSSEELEKIIYENNK